MNLYAVVCGYLVIVVWGTARCLAYILLVEDYLSSNAVTRCIVAIVNRILCNDRQCGEQKRCCDEM